MVAAMKVNGATVSGVAKACTSTLKVTYILVSSRVISMMAKASLLLNRHVPAVYSNLMMASGNKTSAMDKA